VAAAVVLDVPDRADELVEHRIFNGPMWPDGCDLAPSCLACPFEKCRFDEPNGAQTMRARVTRERVMQATAEGLSPRATAAAAGVSLRTVFRLRSAAR